MLEINRTLLAATFDHFIACGRGRNECQVLWTGPWHSPARVTRVVHTRHFSHASGFDVDSTWLNELWLDLASAGCGIRAQVHTHPDRAFHSTIDDAFPIIHSVGFLSLVLPNFGTRRSLEGAYLAELTDNGKWRDVNVRSHLQVL